MDFRRDIIHPILCFKPDVGLSLIPTANKTVNCQNCQQRGYQPILCRAPYSFSRICEEEPFLCSL